MDPFFFKKKMDSVMWIRIMIKVQGNSYKEKIKIVFMRYSPKMPMLSSSNDHYTPTVCPVIGFILFLSWKQLQKTNRSGLKKWEEK